MIVCPNCRHREFIGALFCSECGAKLDEEEIHTQPVSGAYSSIAPGEQPIPQIETIPGQSASPDSPVSIKIIATGDVLGVANREEVTLGRANEGQSILPDVDLTDYQAYQQGVSRLHASLRIQGRQVKVVDLASANGTRINGKKIPPNEPRIVYHGDVLSLGKLKVQILIRNV
jgi:pSer/pThr/pTyr-binding forkhead associated (FHA) protein